MNCSDNLNYNIGFSLIGGLGIKARLVAARLAKNATSINLTLLDSCTIPCQGFGRFTKCFGGGEELFYWSGVNSNNNGSYTLTGVIKGLPCDGCNVIANTSLQFEHLRSEEIILADRGIRYYDCHLWNTIDDIKKYEWGCLSTLSDFLNLSNKKPCGTYTIWNGGNPYQIYWGSFDGVNYQAKPISSNTLPATVSSIGTVQLKCTPTSTTPIVYNVGCTAVDNLVATSDFICTNIWKINNFALYPEYGSNINTLVECKNSSYNNILFGDHLIDTKSITTDSKSKIKLNVIVNIATNVNSSYTNSDSNDFYLVVKDNTNSIIYTTHNISNINSIDSTVDLWGTLNLIGETGIIPQGTYTVETRNNILSLNITTNKIKKICYDILINPIC